MEGWRNSGLTDTTLPSHPILLSSWASLRSAHAFLHLPVCLDLDTRPAASSSLSIFTLLLHQPGVVEDGNSLPIHFGVWQEAQLY
jgi:hypothetical protein